MSLKSKSEKAIVTWWKKHVLDSPCPDIDTLRLQLWELRFLVRQAAVAKKYVKHSSKKKGQGDIIWQMKIHLRSPALYRKSRVRTARCAHLHPRPRFGTSTQCWLGCFCPDGRFVIQSKTKQGLCLHTSSLRINQIKSWYAIRLLDDAADRTVLSNRRSSTRDERPT